MNEGFIKISRKIRKSHVADMGIEGLGFLLYLVEKANWEDKSWFDGKRVVEVPRGSFITSLEKMRKELRVSTQKIRTLLAKFEILEILTRTSTNGWTMINVLNYEKYQGVKSVNNKRTTNEQQTNNKRTTTTKEIKEIKEIIHMRSEDFEEFWRVYPRKIGKAKALAKFMGLPRSLLPTILSSVEEAKRTWDWKKDGGRFIPHPTTWLNGSRWEDEFSPEDFKPPSPSSGAPLPPMKNLKYLN